MSQYCQIIMRKHVHDSPVNPLQAHMRMISYVTNVTTIMQHTLVNTVEEMWIVCIWVPTNSAPFDRKLLFTAGDRGGSLRIFSETDRRRGEYYLGVRRP